MLYRYFSFAFLILAFSLSCFSQTSNLRDADYYLKILESSKDSLYKEILVRYEKHQQENPEDFASRIEKCRLIELAFYDSYNEMNPNEEDYQLCVDELLAKFPDEQEVLLYQLEYAWGDSAIALCNRILDKNRASPGSWSNENLATVYQKLARQYQYHGTSEQVIESAELAQELNDTLDLSLMIAQQYSDKNQYELAKQVLLNDLDSTDEAYELRNKGNLLLELGLEREALEALNYARKDESIYIDDGEIAETLIANEQFIEARAYLIKDLEGSYTRVSALHTLFSFDYKHSPADSVLSTYRALMEEGVTNDLFGKYRAMMLFKTPLKGWAWFDVVKLILLILLIGLMVIIPYLWILPIHYTSERFNIKSSRNSLTEATWGLSDFWLLSSGILLIQVFAWIVFDYQGLLGIFGADIYSAENSRISLNQANEALLYFSCVLVFILGYMKKTDFAFLKTSQWKLGKSIGLGFLYAFLLRAIYFAFARNGLLPGYDSAIMGTVVDSMKSINEYYHPSITFLFSVILVPFYEEYMFRGIMLNSMENKIKFIAANIIQATFFALLHDNIELFLFFFLFGIIAGYLVRKSNSMLPAIAFHMTNNLFAFIAIMRL